MISYENELIWRKYLETGFSRLWSVA